MELKRYTSFINESAIESEKEAWLEKNNQRLTYYTGNPSAFMLATEKDPSVKETWGDLDEEGKAKLLLSMFTIPELEKELTEFEDIDD